MRARLATVVFAAALLLFVGLSEVWAQGCAMCQASLPGAEDPLAHGFNYTVFVFLGVTYGLVGFVGGWIGFRYWRAANRSRPEPRVLSFEAARKEELL